MRKGQRCSEETRRKIGEAKCGVKRAPFSEEWKKKIGDAERGERNPNYGKHHSEETRRKISEAKKGKCLSDEHRRKISIATRGENNPNFGKHLHHSEEARRKISEAIRGEKHPFYGKHRSEETRKKISENHADITGDKNPNYGKPCTEEVRKKISEAIRGKYCGDKNPFYGCHHTEETLKKQRDAKRGIPLSNEHRRKISEASPRGERHHAWKGGISFGKYCPKFNNAFKERVRVFFGRRCVECSTPEDRRKLDVHHVNYDKMMCCNDVKPLFVALCRGHNTGANNNREYWEQHFTDIINEKYGGLCY